MANHTTRHIAGILQELAQGPDGAELHRHARPVVIRPTSGDQLQVYIVEMKEPAQLRSRRLPRESSLVATLLGWQELQRTGLFPIAARRHDRGETL
jgi:hypothetical protein